MDRMEDVLIDCDVIDLDVITSDAHASTSRSSSRKQAEQSDDVQLSHFASAEVHWGPERSTGSDRRPTEGGTVTNAIMMYSPDIPSAEGRNAYDTGPNLANYYTMIETEETVKCVISTALFCAIIVAIVLVAFLENPMM